MLIDSVNGAGSVIAPQLLHDLGCQVTQRLFTLAQVFPRNPEPTADNCQATAAAVAQTGAAVGFIQDPDADELSAD